MSSKLMITADRPEELAVVWDALAASVAVGTLTTRIDLEGLHIHLDLRATPAAEPALVEVRREPVYEALVPEEPPAAPQEAAEVAEVESGEDPVVAREGATTEPEGDELPDGWCCTDASLAVLRREPGVWMSPDDVADAVQDVTGGETYPRRAVGHALRMLAQHERCERRGTGTALRYRWTA